MTQAVPQVPAGARIPIRDIVPWAVLFGVLAMIVLYVVTQEQGAASLFSGSYVHEFLHDGRHMLAVPCH